MISPDDEDRDDSDDNDSGSPHGDLFVYIQNKPCTSDIFSKYRNLWPKIIKPPSLQTTKNSTLYLSTVYLLGLHVGVAIMSK